MPEAGDKIRGQEGRGDFGCSRPRNIEEAAGIANVPPRYAAPVG